MDWSKQIQLKAGLSTEISAEDKRHKERFDKVIDMMKNEEMKVRGVHNLYNNFRASHH